MRSRQLRLLGPACEVNGCNGEAVKVVTTREEAGRLKVCQAHVDQLTSKEYGWKALDGVPQTG